MTTTAIKDYTVKNFGFEADVTIEVFEKFENGADATGVWEYVQAYIHANPVEFGLE